MTGNTTGPSTVPEYKEPFEGGLAVSVVPC
jgi:hypothetical protein